MQHKKKPPGDEPGAGNNALATHPPNSKRPSRPQDKRETIRRLLWGDLLEVVRHRYGHTAGRVSLSQQLPSRPEKRLRLSALGSQALRTHLRQPRED